MSSPDLTTRAGTFMGAGLSLLLQVSAERILETIVIATVGAVVSFTVSYLLQLLLKKK